LGSINVVSLVVEIVLGSSVSSFHTIGAMISLHPRLTRQTTARSGFVRIQVKTSAFNSGGRVVKFDVAAMIGGSLLCVAYDTAGFG
jgi:hypothetical protein